MHRFEGDAKGGAGGAAGSAMIERIKETLVMIPRCRTASSPPTYARLHSKFVTDVTVGLSMKKKTNNRATPYTVPERSRTKSENSDGCGADAKETPAADTWMEHSSSYVSVLDPKLGHTFTRTKKQRTKKSQSLENIQAENIDASQPSHEMEFVSSRIQKLKVIE